ncbi:Phage portal protein, lambda family [uncultured Pleomorphomonas sp.]|uniref:Phage portal protein, lambda family n=1 Tax=uncultured Pleomorphomonas sp. TaxID=442121 RepID=A0A212LQV4_9HYPH|nr:phage portal protein [uncultured Pleomorphomonas sp.]SCM79958.1 Phage portal protein, lambda family [uncultured Pleomorphomonas sp.]
MAGNILDRTIGFFSPRAGAERLAYRRMMEVQEKARAAYDGASTGRIGGGWSADEADPNWVIGMNGRPLRARAADLLRNNPLAKNADSKHADYIVGTGIIPRAKTGNAESEKLINDLFDKWTKVAFVDGLDFYGGCHKMAKMMVGDGEVYARRRDRRLSDGLPVPLQVEILSATMCDWSKNGFDVGGKTVQGVAFSPLNQRKGYWMFPDAPGSNTGGWTATVRDSGFIPADQIAHLFEADNNQVHGVTWLSSVTTDLYNLADYEFAENVRKKAESCLVGVVIPGTPDYDPNNQVVGGTDPILKDPNGNPVQRMEPGMFVVAHGGKDIRFNTPAATAGIETYIRVRHRVIAAGLRIPYELLTGDFSQANFASGKLGLLAYKIFVEHVQWHYMIPLALQRMWDWFIDAAKLAGKIPMDLEVGVEWTPPEIESLSRYEDAQADELEMRIGKRSPQEVISKTGRAPQTVFNEFVEWFDMIAKSKVKLLFDYDVAHVSKNGQFQGQSTSQGGTSNDKSKDAGGSRP